MSSRERLRAIIQGQAGTDSSPEADGGSAQGTTTTAQAPHPVAPRRLNQHDPVVRFLEQRLTEQIDSGEVDIPRSPEVAKEILDLLNDRDAKIDAIEHSVRRDPVLAGRLLEIANSALYAGSLPAKDLKSAVIRLGMKTISATALELSANMNGHRGQRRAAILARMWKYSFAAGLACEEVARLSAQPQGPAFLTGLLHSVAHPAIVQLVSQHERTREIPRQKDEDVAALVAFLGTKYSEKVARVWNVAAEMREAIRLQDAKPRERRNRPLAQVLVCAKALVTDLGVGVARTPIDFTRDRDFKFLGLDDPAKLEELRSPISQKMRQVTSF